QTAAVLLEPHVSGRTRRSALRARYAELIDAGGPRIVAQPIVDVATGERVGAETLSRFPEDWGSPRTSASARPSRSASARTWSSPRSPAAPGPPNTPSATCR